MPGKKSIFTPSSILFRPHQQPQHLRFLVEAPGTAPGSEKLITPLVYCHSRRTGSRNIGTTGRQFKAKAFEAGNERLTTARGLHEESGG